MAMRMLDKFEKYWFQINGIMGVATVLDPRYKLRLLHYYFPLIYTNGEDAKKKIERIQDICYNLLNEYSLKSKASEVGASYQSSASSLPSPDESETDHMSKYDKFVASDFKGNVKNELDSYLEECVLQRLSDFDILNVLAIPISTVASESAFSIGGRFISPHRSRLHHDTLEALMCSQDWLWNEAKEIDATNSECYTTFHDDVDDETNEESMEKNIISRGTGIPCGAGLVGEFSPNQLAGTGTGIPRYNGDGDVDSFPGPAPLTLLALTNWY
ncbi:hypothetical protein ACS0TY_032129 [Phlomoides rotata]